MKILTISYFLKFKLISNPLFMLIVIPSIALTTTVSDSKQAVKYLLFALFADFITGIWASCKKEKKPILQVIKSEKLRRSMIKTTSYIVVIISVLKLEELLKIKPIHFETFSELHFTFTFISIGLCIAIELWSIIMENLPICGFDFVGKLRVIITGVKKIKTEIND